MQRLQLKFVSVLGSLSVLSYLCLRGLHDFSTQSVFGLRLGCNGVIDPANMRPGIEIFKQQRGDPSTIHIAFIFDERGRKMVAGAMRSILATTEHPIEFHLVCSPGEDQELVKTFGNVGPHADQLHFYNYSRCKAFNNEVGHMMGRANPMMNICRMMLPDILPASLERVMYMDADLTVVRDLGPIFHTEFNEDQMIGQSMDTYGKLKITAGQWPRAYEVELVGWLKAQWSSKNGKRSKYSSQRQQVFHRGQFNAGVGVYDLKKFRERNFTNVIANNIKEGYKMSQKRLSYEPTQDSMNSYFRKHPKVTKVLPCGANYQFRSQWKALYCGNKDVYIAHSYNPGSNDNIKMSPYGKRMIYFWGDCTNCCRMPAVPLTSTAAKEMGHSDLKPLFRYTAGCPHQPYNCTNGIESLNGFILDTSLH